MNWEYLSLNRIYKTNEFKPSTIRFVNIKNPSFSLKVKGLPDLYNLTEYNIKCNKKGALYKSYSPYKSSYYDYKTNYLFLELTHIINVGEKRGNNDYLIKLNELFHVYFEKHGLPIEKDPFYQCTFLILFDHTNEVLVDIYYSVIKEVLKSSNVFICGEKPGVLDILCLSILFNSSFQKLKNESNENNNLRDWIDKIETIINMKLTVIYEEYEKQSKDLLVDTYKFTSNNDLVEYVNKGMIVEVNKLLSEGENVESREFKEFKTLTHITCRKGDLPMLELLIQYGCNLESHDSEQMTPIFDSIYTGNLEFCEFLIEKKNVNLTHCECQDRTLLYWACSTGNLKTVEYLLNKNKIDINKASKMGRTALSKACWNGQTDIVIRLLKLPGIFLKYSGNDKRTPLHNSVWGENGKKGKNGIHNKDSPAITQALITAGAGLEDEDYEGYTALIIACRSKGIESMKVLLNSGANVNHCNIYKSTPLIEIVKYPDNLEGLEIFIQMGKSILNNK